MKQNFNIWLLLLLFYNPIYLFSQEKLPEIIKDSNKEPPNITSKDISKIIADAKEKVFPSLVFVKPIIEEYDSGKLTRAQVFGSGVIISPDGYVVTNFHVVKNALSIKCVLSNKSQVNATVIGSDKDTDIALIKLDTKEVLPFAEFGDSSKTEEGQFVMAMGSPFGFSRSISFGIISYTKRYLDYGPYNLWIQTDAAINPGNSGGPLVDTEGKIIGINTLGGANIGFSIHSNKVKEVVEILKKNGAAGVKRIWTGIQFQALKDFSSENILPDSLGVLVSGVEFDSPANNAEILSGDIILECDGVATNCEYVEELPDIRNFFANLKAETSVTLKIKRNKNIISLKLNLIQKGKVEGENFEAKRWNMTFKEINKFDTPLFAFFKEKGVFVLGVDTPGNGEFSGFVIGDIILKIDDIEINSLDEIKKLYAESLLKIDANKKYFVEVLRKSTHNFLLLDYKTDYKKLGEEK
jgi:serine protease Do